MFEDNDTQVTTKSTKEVLDMLQKVVDNGWGDQPFYVTVPYRNGIGFHCEGVVNITDHEGIVDMHVTMPDADDVKGIH